MLPRKLGLLQANAQDSVARVNFKHGVGAKGRDKGLNIHINFSGLWQRPGPPGAVQSVAMGRWNATSAIERAIDFRAGSIED